MAMVQVCWLEQGARPEAGSGMAATAVFVVGGDAEVIPNWPAGGVHHSVLLEFAAPDPDGDLQEAKVDFLARDEVADLLSDGARFLLLAGAKAIADVRVTSVRWPLRSDGP